MVSVSTTAVNMTKMEALSGVSSRAIYCKFWGIPYIEEDSYEAAEPPAYQGAAVGGISVRIARTSLWQHSSACSLSGIGSHILLAEGRPSVNTQLYSCAGRQAAQGVRHQLPDCAELVLGQHPREHLHPLALHPCPLCPPVLQEVHAQQAPAGLCPSDWRADCVGGGALGHGCGE